MKKTSTHLVQWPGGCLDFSLGPLVMGVLNVTPDSFSDGGQFLDPGRAIEQGRRMVAEGAALIDVGAESTRPGAEAVSIDEQIRRAAPVIQALAQELSVPISIDTRDVAVAQAALEVGAGMINDITALADDAMAELAAEVGVPVVLMHMRGIPQTMQREPAYRDVVKEVIDFLTGQAKKAEHFGVLRNRIFLDPGIGFGKTLAHNLTLLRHLDRLAATGYRVLVGPSRKRFLGEINEREKPEDRVFGTAATVAYCVEHGAAVLRVHDVGAMVDVVRTVTAIRYGTGHRMLD
ncbi:dihydropteroate synthase [Planctomycetota bacterium]